MPVEVTAALDTLIERVGKVEPLHVNDWHGIGGRVLADAVKLDRDSPACDVSAMDGFAVRQSELVAGTLPVDGECRIGEPPAQLADQKAMRIYTGSPVPAGSDTVVRLEWVDFESGQITLRSDIEPPRQGSDIRRRGENALAGTPLLAAGTPLTAAAITALATAGPSDIALYRPLKVVVITTGNELESGKAKRGESSPPWRLRDSNGPALAAMLQGVPWIASVELRHAEDTLDALVDELTSALETADAIALTGGVSKGAYDYVPEAVGRVGGETLFHRIRARPGQPTFAAVVGPKPVLGLPGNPLSVLCTGRRLLVPALRQRAGFTTPDPPTAVVEVADWGEKSLPLTWWRPVTMSAPGTARIAKTKGSGDVCGPATTDGFIEAPPESNSPGPYAFFPWTV